MKLITGISELVTNSDPTELMARPSLGAGDLHTLTDAALIIDDGKVAWSGPAAEANAALNSLTLGRPRRPRRDDRPRWEGRHPRLRRQPQPPRLRR